MANHRRKAKLSARAHAYAQHRTDDTTPWENAFHGFEDGYRRAMADLRRKLAALPGATADDVRTAVNEFLRPLR